MSNPFAEDPFDAGSADDPFGDEDLFDAQRDSFPNMEWVIGRLVLVWPTEIKSVKGDNGDYLTAVCRVAVLDGEPTQDMPKIPCEIEPFRFNSESCINDLKHLVGATRPKLARVAEKPSKKNKLIMARFFDAPSDQDKVRAREYMKAHARR